MDWKNIEATLVDNETVFIDIWNPNDSIEDEFQPVFNKVADDHQDVKFARINTDTEPDLARALGVENTPTLMVVKKRMDILQKTEQLGEQMLQDLVEVVRGIDVDELLLRTCPADD
jgi:thioredoxin 1